MSYMSSEEIINFSKNTKYKKFVKDRDALLEKILRHSQLQIASEMANSFTSVIGIIKAKYTDTLNGHLPLVYKVKIFEKDLDRIFDQLGMDIIPILLDLRKKSNMLAHKGEAEAIYQVTGMLVKTQADENTINRKALELFNQDNSLHKKINLYFSKLKRALLNEIETALVLEYPVDKAVGNVYLKLPKKKILPPRPLKPVKPREAAGGSIKFGLFSDSTWGAVLKDYEEDYNIALRGPENVFDIKNPWNDEPIKDKLKDEDAIYGWELEKDITHDFVKEVREGQVAAANLNGITDFIWIAILDDKTCQKCCQWRDGLSSSEIEQRLKKDKDLADYCDAITPVAHPNCRCTMAPLAKNLGSYDDSDTQKDFEKWLYPNQ